MIYHLNNGKILICVESHGAELSSIMKVNDPYEYLWQGNPMYWKRRAPVLFPIVGGLKDGTYYYDGKAYKMENHGFARDSEFLCNYHDDNSIVFKLTSTSETYMKYPFDFELYISYELCDEKIIVTYKVVNMDEKIMPFSIGAHPAFNWTEEGRFEFPPCSVSFYEVTGEGIVKGSDVDLPERMAVDVPMFENDALIYSGVYETAFYNDSRKVDMKFEGFPYVGLWSLASGAPFVCIEPWYGIADLKGHNQDIMTKEGIQLLDPQSVFEASYTISI